MKLISLHLKNYQAHVDSTINFVDGLNVIIGPTDAGKSSIIRSLLKIIRDTPAGKGFIHTGEDTCTLTLVFENFGEVYTLIRTVSASKNEYSLQKAGEAVQSFAGFGRDIPQEILDVVSMALIQLENGETVDLHFADQYDLPFMLAGTASMRSRLLGRIAGLHILGKASLAASKDERQAGTEISHVKSECDQLSKEIESMPDIAALETQVESLQTRLIDAKALDSRVEHLQSLSTALNSIKTTGKQLAQEVKALPQLDIDFETLRTATIRLLYLTQLNESLNAIDQRLNSLVVPAEINIDFAVETTLIKRIESLQKIWTQLCTLDKEIFGIDLSEYDTKARQAEQAWQNELKLLGICPTCKQPITEVHYHAAKEKN